MKRAVIAAVIATACVGGCATKRYPIATNFSAAEASAMDCDDLRLELIRGEQIQAQIADTANLDWRSVAGFLGDYGIGNAMAKSEADRAVTRRIAAIREAQASKGCLANGGAMAALGRWWDEHFG